MVEINKFKKTELRTAEGYEIATVGRWPVVLPPGGVLAAAELAGLRMAESLLDAGKDFAARDVLDQVQLSAGIPRDVHIEAALLFDEVSQRTRAVRRQALAKVETSPIGPAFGPAIEDLLASAEVGRRALAAATARKDRKAAGEARATIVRAEHRIEELRAWQLDASWQGQARTETLRLAKGRGEIVVVGQARVELDSRDGLLGLHKAGGLTPQELRWGVSFRYLVEAAQERTTSSIAERSGGTPVDPVALGLKRAYASARVSRVEAALYKADPSGRMLDLVRRIAGEGVPLSAFAAGGKSRQLAKEQFRRGLFIAAGVIWRNGLNHQV